VQTRGHAVTIIALLLLLSGCAGYKRTLSDAQGRTITCEAGGKSAAVSGADPRKDFEACVNDAKARGYTQANATQSAPDRM
jgi:hypothetical protein